MPRISIKRRLARRHVFYVIVMLLPVWGYLCFLYRFWLETGSLSSLLGSWSELFLGTIVFLPFAALLAFLIWRLASLRGWHPDLLALARYGDQQELLTQIEAELDDPSRVATFGEAKSFQLLPRELGDAEVWITASWLIYLSGGGNRMTVFRLADLVLVYPEEDHVILADRYGVRLQIAGSEGGRARLLAEILIRVPWALDHFDPEMEKTWNENPQGIIAQVEKRRQDLQREKRT